MIPEGVQGFRGEPKFIFRPFVLHQNMDVRVRLVPVDRILISVSGISKRLQCFGGDVVNLLVGETVVRGGKADDEMHRLALGKLLCVGHGL